MGISQRLQVIVAHKKGMFLCQHSTLNPHSVGHRLSGLRLFAVVRLYGNRFGFAVNHVSIPFGFPVGFHQFELPILKPVYAGTGADLFSL